MNSIGAAGLPADAWAAAAQARLYRERAVERAEVAASWEQDEDTPGGGFPVVTVEALVQGDEPQAVAALVERTVQTALSDVFDGEAGWTAYEWEAKPADS